MQFKINGNNEKLKFGVKFCRIMDEKYNIDYEGFEFGMGVVNSLIGLDAKSPTILSDIIYAALKGEYSQDDIDEAIDEYAEENGLNKLFKEVKSELGKSPTVKETAKLAENSAKENKTNPSTPTKK